MGANLKLTNKKSLQIFITESWWESSSMLRAQLLRGAARLLGPKGRALNTSPALSAIQLKMPSLSPTMEEGTIVKWHKVSFNCY